MCFTYNNAEEYTDKIKNAFDFVTVDTLGKSWCKRNIRSLGIGDGKNCVLFLSDFSDTSGMSAKILLTFFERLCIAYKNDLKISAIKIRSILRDQKIVVVPLTNPDGLEISHSNGENARCYNGLVRKAADGNCENWVSNARGVDISLNFPYRFPDAESTSEKPSVSGYKGPSEASEPETKAVAALCRTLVPKYAVTLSCSGKYISCQSPKSSSDCAMMTQVFKSVSELPIKRIKPQKAYGSFSGWFCKNFSAPAFDFSVSERNTTDFPELYKQCEELLILSAIM